MMLFALRRFPVSRCRTIVDWDCFRVSVGIARGQHLGAYRFVLKDCILAAYAAHTIEEMTDA
jgi:hypothetical protein